MPCYRASIHSNNYATELLNEVVSFYLLRCLRNTGAATEHAIVQSLIGSFAQTRAATELLNSYGRQWRQPCGSIMRSMVEKHSTHDDDDAGDDDNHDDFVGDGDGDDDDVSQLSIRSGTSVLCSRGNMYPTVQT